MYSTLLKHTSMLHATLLDTPGVGSLFCLVTNYMQQHGNSMATAWHQLYMPLQATHVLCIGNQPIDQTVSEITCTHANTPSKAGA